MWGRGDTDKNANKHLTWQEVTSAMTNKMKPDWEEERMNRGMRYNILYIGYSKESTLKRQI